MQFSGKNSQIVGWRLEIPGSATGIRSFPSYVFTLSNDKDQRKFSFSLNIIGLYARLFILIRKLFWRHFEVCVMLPEILYFADNLHVFGVLFQLLNFVSES